VKTKRARYSVRLDSKEWRGMLSELSSLAAHSPNRLVKRAVRFLNLPSKVGRVKYRATKGALVIASIEPSNRFRNLLAAFRAVKV
jgi:hypothetical protein